MMWKVMMLYVDIVPKKNELRFDESELDFFFLFRFYRAYLINATEYRTLHYKRTSVKEW